MTKAEKPLVTFALFSYNQSQFIEEAVRGALSQTYTPLQIILSDDASIDNTYELICELVSKYDGPHQIILNKNQENLGIGGHVNRVMEMAQGEFVVVAAGDDISDNDRCEKIADVFLKSKEIYSVWSAARYIDELGAPVLKKFPGGAFGFSDKTMVRNLNPLIGATHAWRREVFDFFGPLLKEIVFEDNAISFRSYLMGEINYIDQDLVSYRSHSNNITNFSKISDYSKLYSSAAKRNEWSLVGIAQRTKDLDIAKSKLPVFRRNYLFLSVELVKMQHVFRRRLIACRQYPKISFFMIAGIFRDVEIAKIATRSLLASYLSKN